MHNHDTSPAIQLGVHLDHAVRRLVARVQQIQQTLREDERGLTSTEWALLVAGAAAMAIAVVAAVRAATSTSTGKIKGGVNVNTTFSN